jgi:hypothetical protein
MEGKVYSNLHGSRYLITMEEIHSLGMKLSKNGPEKFVRLCIDKFVEYLPKDKSRAYFSYVAQYYQDQENDLHIFSQFCGFIVYCYEECILHSKMAVLNFDEIDELVLKKIEHESSNATYIKTVYLLHSFEEGIKILCSSSEQPILFKHIVSYLLTDRIKQSISNTDVWADIIVTIYVFINMINEFYFP